MESHHGSDQSRPTQEPFILWDPLSHSRACWMFALSPDYTKLEGEAYLHVALAYGHCPYGGSGSNASNAAQHAECAPIGMAIHVPVTERLTSPYWTIVDGVQRELAEAPLGWKGLKGQTRECL
jgi:hypothetical protein